jgi:hypothetical protein
MQISLKKTKISLSEAPKNSVAGALIVLIKGLQPIFIDVMEGKQSYKLPNGLNHKDVLSIYLRVY